MGAMKKGSMLLEFVLTMPILIMLIMFVIQFAQIMVVRQFVAYAAFCSTRSMLCSNPSEWDPELNPKKERCTHQAARRVLAWVNIFGTPKTAHLRGWEEKTLKSFNPSTFSDIDNTPLSYTTRVYGSKKTHDVVVPGWGQIPESNSVDDRLEVDVMQKQGKYVASTVKYKFPLLIPGAGQMISAWVNESDGKQALFHGVPFITLTETCVLPLPYSTANLPTSAFDYTSYD